MILDIIMLVYLGLSILMGYHIGLFRMLSKTIAFIAAIIIAFNISSPITNMICDDYINPAINDTLTEKLESSGISQTITDIYNLSTGVNPEKISDCFGKDNENIMEAIISNLDADKIKEMKSDKTLTKKQVVDNIINMVDPLIIKVTRPIWFLICALLLYIIIRIVLFIVINVIDKFELLNSIQKVGGCAAGGILAIIVCYTAVYLINIAHPEITSTSFVYNLIAQ